MFAREISQSLQRAISHFPICVLTGPRQSGKTTLLKHLLPDFEYISLESPDKLLLVKADPRSYLEKYKHGLIIDEAQHYPDIFSYLQEIVDNDPNCRIILSGSQNFLLAEKISQTLAGRSAIFELLPLSYSEYKSDLNYPVLNSPWPYLYHGSYPRPYHQQLPINIWYEGYIRTYLERDVRALINVKDLSLFQLFLKLCAGMHGQEFNASSIASNVGVSQTTIMNWLSLLEASYVIFQLRPYYKNYKKRLTKRPKIYFYDPGLVCRLLGIDSIEHLQIHSSRGAIFEGFVISEVIKYYFKSAQRPPIYYWREHSGHEVDLIIEKANQLIAIEIKSSATLTNEFVKGLNHLSKTIQDQSVKTAIIYTGKSQSLGNTAVVAWDEIDEFLTAQAR